MPPDQPESVLEERPAWALDGRTPGTLRGARVVIADDDRVIRMLLEAALRSLGVGEVIAVNDGLDCLELIDAVLPPDLIVLDVLMPELDGIETCRRIRDGSRWQDVPIVIHTMLSAPRDRVRCFEAGATDVVGKPVYLPELRARLRVHLEAELMTRSLARFRSRFAEELRMAERMQRGLLPDLDRLAGAIAPLGLSVDAVYHPCDEIGGDLWDVRVLDERRISVLMVDLAGHGLVAAMNAFRLRGMMGALDAARIVPGAWLAGLNEAMHAAFGGDVLATALRGVIDLETNSFVFASAGSPRPILGIPGAAGRIETRFLDSAGLMLGVAPGMDYPERRATFAPGSFLFLFSDGAIADRGPEDQVLAGLAATAQTLGERPGPTPLATIGAWLARENAGPRSDDVTMVWIGRDGSR